MGKDNKGQNNTETASVITRETIGLTLGVFSILIMIMLFTGSLIFGDLGTSICSFLFGTFGFMSYFLFPCLLFAAVALVMGKNPIKIKGFTLFAGLSLVLLGLLIHAIITGGYTHDTYGAYLSECFSAGRNGAFGCSPFGAIGGIFVYPFAALATNAGAIVIFVVATGLCLYLTVNSVLVFKGIRWGLGRASAAKENKIEEEKKEAEEPTPQPTRFESLDNVRTAGGTQPPVRTPNAAYAPMPPYRAEQNVGYTPVTFPPANGQATGRREEGNAVYPNPPMNGNRPENTNNGQSSEFNKSYNILYGNNENPDEYRSKNLIFDSSSRYNSRIQNNSNNSVNSTGAENGAYPNYSEYSSQEIDRAQAQSRQPREVIRPTEEQNPGARREYSVYKTDVFNSSASNSAPSNAPLGGNAPLQPRYKAPDPVTPPRADEQPVYIQRPVEPEIPAKGAEYGYTPMRNERDFSAQERETAPIEPEREAYSAERTPLRDVGRTDEEIDSDFTERDLPPSRDYEEQRSQRESSFRNLFDDGDTDEPEESVVPDFTAERGSRGEPLPEMEEDVDLRFSDDGRRGRGDVPEFPDRGRGVDNGRMPAVDETLKKKPTPPAQEEVKPHVFKDYVYPPADLFNEYKDTASVDYNEIERNKLDIVDTLAAFKIDIQITNVQVGPTFTRYDFTFPKNVNANSISKYSNNIALALKVTGKVNICTNFANGTMAIEVPNKVRPIVGFRSLLGAESYVNAKTGALQICIGKNVEGKTATASLAKMTHLLVAGTTGSGKSVFLHEIIMSLIMKYSPEEVRLILIDPKQVEFSLYDNLPHLMINEILSDPNKIVVMLNWMINEMERRYTLFRYAGVRNIDEFNAAAKKREEKLAKIVIIADEVADIMAVAKKEVEDRISRIAAKARAAGIHLVLATQRPTVEVITGTLKANLPSRFALRVSEELNSRIVLDESGAENLLGNGDLLYKWGSMFNAERVQASFIDTSEIQRVCDFIRDNNEAYFDQTAADFINSGGKQSSASSDGQEGDGDGEIEPVYIDALRFVVRSGSASISMIQRKCSVGYNKAGKIIEWMEVNKYISEFDGAKSRKVLLTAEEFVEKFGEL